MFHTHKYNADLLFGRTGILCVYVCAHVCFQMHKRICTYAIKQVY